MECHQTRFLGCVSERFRSPWSMEGKDGQTETSLDHRRVPTSAIFKVLLEDWNIWRHHRVIKDILLSGPIICIFAFHKRRESLIGMLLLISQCARQAALALSCWGALQGHITAWPAASWNPWSVLHASRSPRKSRGGPFRTTFTCPRCTSWFVKTKPHQLSDLWIQQVIFRWAQCLL